MRFIQNGSGIRGERETGNPVELDVAQVAHKILDLGIREQGSQYLHDIVDAPIPNGPHKEYMFGLRFFNKTWDNVGIMTAGPEDKMAEAMRLGMFEHFFGIKPQLEPGEFFNCGEIIFRVGQLVSFTESSMNSSK